MVRILVLLGAINAVFIEFFHLHPSGAVNHAFGVNRDAYVAYLAVMMVKEQQVSGFDFGGVGYRPSLGDLLARVAQQVLAEQAHDDLCETGAIHAQCILSAP